MSVECACVDVGECDIYNDFYDKRARKARKQYKCEECNKVIDKGERYIYVSAKTEGCLWQFRHCADCESLLKTFFTCGYWHGMLWENFEEHVRALDGKISSECLLQLTPRARDMALEIIQESFDHLDELEEE